MVSWCRGDFEKLFIFTASPSEMIYCTLQIFCFIGCFRLNENLFQKSTEYFRFVIMLWAKIFFTTNISKPAKRLSMTMSVMAHCRVACHWNILRICLRFSVKIRGKLCIHSIEKRDCSTKISCHYEHRNNCYKKGCE